ncbi:MAG: DUF202 domain-containing protein [Anaerolineaceae bacterium]|nr:DUF202 domain-containing protein [Anaerolineaceae bacterium]
MEKIYRDILASERTLLAAERNFAAWVRTGLACLATGLAVNRALSFPNELQTMIARVVGIVLVILAALIFVFGLVDYRRANLRLSEDGIPKKVFHPLVIMTILLLIVCVLVPWLIC